MIHRSIWIGILIILQITCQSHQVELENTYFMEMVLSVRESENGTCAEIKEDSIQLVAAFYYAMSVVSRYEKIYFMSSSSYNQSTIFFRYFIELRPTRRSTISQWVLIFAKSSTITTLNSKYRRISIKWVSANIVVWKWTNVITQSNIFCRTESVQRMIQSNTTLSPNYKYVVVFLLRNFHSFCLRSGFFLLFEQWKLFKNCFPD